MDKDDQKVVMRHDVLHLQTVVMSFCVLLLSSVMGFAAREVRVGFYEYAPLIMHDSHGVPIGVFPEILAEVARREGYKITYVNGTWVDSLRWAKEGEIDLLVACGKKRGEGLDYSVTSEPAFFTWSQLYTTKRNRGLSIIDLNGKKVAALRNTLGKVGFQEYVAPFDLNIQYVEVDDIETAFEMVVKGEVVAAISDSIAGEYFETVYPISHTSVVFYPQFLGFGTAKNKNQDLLDAIDRYLTAAKADPYSRYYQILEKWKEPEAFHIPDYVIWGFSGALGLLILSTGGNLLLKRTVRRKTLELSEKNSVLQAEVEERRRAQEGLKQAKEAAEKANNEKDHFIAMMSHELRTPLTPVMAALATGDPRKGLNPQELDLVRRNVELEALLIDDLLDATRIKKGKLTLNRETIDACEYLRRALKICEPEMEAKHQELTLKTEAQQRQVLADPLRIQQVFWNLIMNAVKFTPEHGQIQIRASNAEGLLRIEIADTGVGIDPELLSVIFNPFEQAEKTKTRRYGGLGLGLHIARSIVEMHGGHLKAFSKGKGQGATFTVELTTVAPVAVSRALAPAAKIPDSRLQRILLVEDNADTLQTMARLLERWGYSVTTADCVQSALTAASRDSFHLLVSDLGLPDGSGLDIIRQVKSRYGLRGIAFSGFGTDDDIRQSREAGFEVHITKPINIPALRTAIQSVASKAP